jgi:hypothetical protein
MKNKGMTITHGDQEQQCITTGTSKKKRRNVNKIIIIKKNQNRNKQCKTLITRNKLTMKILVKE